MSKQEILEFEFKDVKAETDKAWLLILDGSDFFNPIKEWFPKSQCEIDEDDSIIYVPEWLAVEKGLV